MKYRRDNDLCCRCGRAREDLDKKLCETCRNDMLVRNRLKCEQVRCACGWWTPKEQLVCDRCIKKQDLEVELVTSTRKCNKCKGPNDRVKSNCSKCFEHTKNIRLVQRKKVLDQYGGECECCGEKSVPFLQLDHINGDGSKHRKQDKSTNGNFYRWVEKNNYPKNLQVLCCNCNWTKGTGKECYHVALRKAELEKQLPFVDLFYGG